MRTIWKYPLTPTAKAAFESGDAKRFRPEASIHVPHGAETLRVEIQDDQICVWMLVDSDDTKGVARRFTIYGTGHSVEHPKESYVGTVFDGPFVWHVFEGD